MPDPSLTMSPAQRLSGYLNAIDTDADASELRVDEADLIARIYNALGAGPTVSHLTTHVATMLAGIRNNLSSDPDEAAATTEVDVLFGEVLDLLEAAYGDAGDGGGGGGVPAWVQALAAPSSDLPTDALLFGDGTTLLNEYWSAGAEQSVTDIIAAVTGFTFDPGDVVARGVLVEDGNTVRPLATGPLLTSLCSDREQTLVLEIELTGTPGESGDGVLCIGYGVIPDDVQPVPLQLDWYPPGDEGIINWESTNGVNGSFDLVATGTGNAVWKIAVTTKDNSDVVTSINGAAFHTDVASEPDLGLPTIWKFGSNDGPDGSKPLEGYIRSIVRYAAQPDADLPTLSAL